ncbi:hypothetical protein CC2G_003655 [Coprinopsis cinerea AmutBmut pab1-1]|nr:hypothetical protein CC2G_003655 [Coprinopsis cinerea AmutBmut pab1-1]
MTWTPSRGTDEWRPKGDSILFGTPKRERQPDPTTPTRSLFSSTLNTTPKPGLGYLAFTTTPSLSILEEEERKRREEEAAQRAAQEEAEARRKREEAEAAEAAWRAEQERLKKLHEARLAREAEEARKGEEYWVSCGGVLRDEHGNRDLERTQRIREELKLREKEKRLTERWEAYERRWRHLLAVAKSRKVDGIASEVESESGSQAGDDPVTFADMPWPVDKPASEVKLEDITRQNVEAFLLEPLTVRGCTVTKKERVRTSLLRWHPDKMTAIVSIVDPAEKDAVMDGIHAVIHCLQRMNSKL